MDKFRINYLTSLSESSKIFYPIYLYIKNKNVFVKTKPEHIFLPVRTTIVSL